MPGCWIIYILIYTLTLFSRKAEQFKPFLWD